MDTDRPEKWKFKGGIACLDFVNTIGGRIQIDKKDPLSFRIVDEKLNNFNDLIDWANAREIIDNKQAGALEKIKDAKEVFERALKFRESLFHILISILNERKPEDNDISVLNKECYMSRENQKLFFASNKFEWHYSGRDLKGGYILWEVAQSAAELLSSDMLQRVKLCPGENCGWLFLDTSKNKSRQWCDMKDCGNIAKVRRFRDKQKK